MQRDVIDIARSLIDQLMVICVYCDWRDASADAAAAYTRFSSAGASDRDLAFAAYRAATDREEAAARSYACRVACLSQDDGLIASRVTVLG